MHPLGKPRLGGLTVSELRTILKVLHCMREVDNTMPVRHLEALLYVYDKTDQFNGVSLSQISQAIDLSSAATSRIIDKLSNGWLNPATSRIVGGHKLLTKSISHTDERTLEIKLTDKGRELMGKIETLLAG